MHALGIQGKDRARERERETERHRDREGRTRCTRLASEACRERERQGDIDTERLREIEAWQELDKGHALGIQGEWV